MVRPSKKPNSGECIQGGSSYGDGSDSSHIVVPALVPVRWGLGKLATFLRAQASAMAS